MKAKAVARLPLNALRVFEAVARLKSMTRAAEALNVQRSAVSMQMKNLGEYIGVPLVVKAGRTVELTVHGETLLPSVLSGLAQIEETIVALRRAARGQPFTLSVLPAFLHLWLHPRLPGLEAAHPSLRLRIVSSRDLVDLSRGEADAAIRLGPGEWPGVASRKLMDEGLVPVCTPQLAKRVGRLLPGRMPQGAPLLETTIDPWSHWSPAARRGEAPSITADDAISTVRAAEEGKGVALLRTSLVESALKDGRLTALAEPIEYRWRYYWVTTKASAASPGHRLLYEWFRSQAREGPARVEASCSA
jgi:LysR family transcriptional regulator, glycine cleavage system transcriptional activator